MFGIGIVELGVLLLIPFLVLGVSAYLLATARRAAVMDEQLARARRHQVGISVLAAAVALATMPAGAALTPTLGQSTVLPLLPSLMVGGCVRGAVGRRGHVPATDAGWSARPCSTRAVSRACCRGAG